MDKTKILTEEQINTLRRVGLKIKNRREELSSSLERVSDIIRIPLKDLRNIEDANYKEFPDIVFLRGFVRNYCQFLDLASAEIIQSIESVFVDAESKIGSKRGQGKRFNFDNKNYTKILLSILLLWVIIFGAYWIYDYSQVEMDVVEPIPLFEKNEKTQDAVKDQAAKDWRYNLVLIGEKSGWISVTIDKEEPVYIKVEPKVNLAWRAQEKITITLSRGDLAKLTLNGLEDVIAQSEFDKLYTRVYKD